MMLSAAAIAAVACAKETVVKPEGEEPAGEGVTFTAFMQSENPTDAAAETKVAIDMTQLRKLRKYLSPREILLLFMTVKL